MNIAEKPKAFFICKFLFFYYIFKRPSFPFDPLKCKINNKKIPYVCIIQILGLSYYGQSVCLYIHDFFPFFYILIPPEEKRNERLEIELCEFLEEEHSKLKKDKTNNVCIYNIERVKKKCIYGYNEESEEFLKIYFLNPNRVNYFARLLKKKLFKNRVWDLYEVHINYMLHFLCMKNIYGCSEIYVDKNICFRKEFFNEINFQCSMKEDKWNIKKKYNIENIKSNKYLDINAPTLFTNKTTNVNFSHLKRETSYDIECDIKHQHILNNIIYSYEFQKNKIKWKKELCFNLPINHLDSFSKLWIKEKNRCKNLDFNIKKEIFYFENNEDELNYNSFDILTDRTKKLFDIFLKFMSKRGIEEGVKEKEEMAGEKGETNKTIKGVREKREVSIEKEERNKEIEEKKEKQDISYPALTEKNSIFNNSSILCDNIINTNQIMNSDNNLNYIINNNIIRNNKLNSNNSNSKNTENSDSFNELKKLFTNSVNFSESYIEKNDKKIFDRTKGILTPSIGKKDEKLEENILINHNEKNNNFITENKKKLYLNNNNHKMNLKTNLSHSYLLNEKQKETFLENNNKRKCIASLKINNVRKEVIRYVYKKKAPKIKRCYAIYDDLTIKNKCTNGENECCKNVVFKNKLKLINNSKNISNSKKKKINIKYGSLFFLEILTEIKNESCYSSNYNDDEIKAVFYLIRDERLMNYYEDYNNCIGIIATKPFPDILNSFKENEKKKEKKLGLCSNMNYNKGVYICSEKFTENQEKENIVNMIKKESSSDNEKNNDFLNDNQIFYNFYIDYDNISICVVENEIELIKKLIDKINFYSPLSIISYENDKYNVNYINQRCLALKIGNFYKQISKLNDQINFNDLNNIYNKNIKGKVIESLYKLSNISNNSFENLCKHYLKVNLPSINKYTLYYWYSFCKKQQNDNLMIPNNKLTNDTNNQYAYFPYRYITVKYYLMRIYFLLLIYDKIEFLKKKMNFCKYIHVDFLSLINRGSQYIIESFILKMCLKYDYLLYSPSNKEIFNQRPILHTPLVLQPKSSINFFPLLVFDFHSLYSSILIAFNICFSTCIGTLTLKKNNNETNQDEVILKNILKETFSTNKGSNFEQSKEDSNDFENHTFIKIKYQNIENVSCNNVKEKITSNNILEQVNCDNKYTEDYFNYNYKEDFRDKKNFIVDKEEEEIPFEFIKLGVKKKDKNILNKIKNLKSSDIILTSNNTLYVKKHKRKGICSLFLEDILKTRIMLKRCIEKYDNKVTERLKEKIANLKLILNVAVGYIGANFSGRMPCVDISESVVTIGRNFLFFIIEYIKKNYNYVQVLYGDTDSLFLLNESDDLSYSFKLAYDIVKNINNILPEPMYLNFEKIYLPSVLLTKKRYFGFLYKNEKEEKPILELKGLESIRSDQCNLVKNILIQNYFIFYYFRNNSYLSYCCCCCYLCRNFFYNFICTCKESNIHKTYPCFLSKVLQIILHLCNSNTYNKLEISEESNFNENDKIKFYNQLLRLLNFDENNILLKILNFLYKEKYSFLLYIFTNFNDKALKEEIEKIIAKNYTKINNKKSDCCLTNPYNIFKFCLCVKEIDQNSKCCKNKCFCNIKQGIFFFNEKNDKMNYVFNTKIFYSHLSLQLKNIIRELFNQIYDNKISYDNFIIYKKVKLGLYKEQQGNQRKASLPPQAVVAKKILKKFPYFIILYKDKIPYIITKKLKEDKIYNSVSHPFFIKGIHKSCIYLEHFDYKSSSKENKKEEASSDKICENNKISSKENLKKKKLKEINFEYYIQNLILPPLERMLNLLPFHSINIKEIFYKTKRQYNYNNERLEFSSGNSHNTKNILKNNKKVKSKIKIKINEDEDKKIQKKIIKSYVEISKSQNIIKNLNKICLMCSNSEMGALACQYSVHCKIFFKKVILQENISKNQEIIKRFM
ncbi:DNA polymerase zeta catalytic subunit, putative [Plasmodium relictum]|uniref:DNA polymerase n=1 Tax=Plasmodium relictum TaxID=85471 RepID=A0A1J1H2X2_PLARL|nr:DNA polymerase zeta catalytic subunit, putative [Plasmodium relictum]CRG99221.1 DNA polymerase zeta catalytic subunit, putative [Plasmodium relictum]